jgi:hypothetical protein
MHGFDLLGGATAIAKATGSEFTPPGRAARRRRNFDRRAARRVTRACRAPLGILSGILKKRFTRTACPRHTARSQHAARGRRAHSRRHVRTRGALPHGRGPPAGPPRGRSPVPLRGRPGPHRGAVQHRGLLQEGRGRAAEPRRGRATTASLPTRASLWRSSTSRFVTPMARTCLRTPERPRVTASPPTRALRRRRHRD